MGLAFPMSGFAYYMIGMQFWWAYPVIFLPALYNFYDFAKIKLIAHKTEAHKLYLY